MFTVPHDPNTGGVPSDQAPSFPGSSFFLLGRAPPPIPLPRAPIVFLLARAPPPQVDLPFDSLAPDLPSPHQRIPPFSSPFHNLPQSVTEAKIKVGRGPPPVLLPAMAALVELFLRSSSSSAPVDWEAEAYPAYGDYAVLPFLVAFFPALRFLLDRFVFEVLARRLIFGKGYDKLAETDERRKKINKFKESAWKFVYFLSAELLALCVTYNEPWFTNTRYFWVGPGDQLWPDQKMKLKLKAVYMYAAGFYTYSIFALLFWETRRKDFGVSMSHHVATVVLIVMSYICRLSRAGSIILAIHDASDIFLEIGKMAKYSSCEGLAVVAFLLFVASWIILRLMIFPFWVLRSTSYEVAVILDKEKHQFYSSVYYYLFNSLLFSLLVLHIYWWVLIYRMLVKQIQSRGRVGDDVRSDSEGEDDHED